MLTCSTCGVPIERKHRRGRNPRYCAECLRPGRATIRRCEDCAELCTGTRCRPCEAKRRTVRAPDDRRVRRLEREHSAPGLNVTARKALLHTWQSQGRTCTYCGGPPETVDHVVPLVRGGTNHEGNLTPCCRRCNSSKSGYTLVEWRTGRRLPPMQHELRWPGREANVRNAVCVAYREPHTLFELCSNCEHEFARVKGMCQRCYCRLAYRRTVGIPDRAPLYSRTR